MNKSRLISKLLHCMLLLSFFLPAIIPSCGEKSETNDTIDTTVNVIEKPFIADTTNDPTSKLIQPSDSSTLKKETLAEDEKPETDTTKSFAQSAFFFLLQPDHKNYSVVGYVYFYFTESCIVIFFLFSCWSAWLCFRSNNASNKFKVSLLAFSSISIYALDNLTAVIWGFWIVYILSILILIESWIAKIANNKKMYNEQT